MKKNSAMKKYLWVAICMISVCAAKAQVNIPYEEIDYNVHYHWGIINVMIAHGTVTVQTDGNRFIGTLDGNSIPWNGRVFCVSDTLHTIMTPAGKVSNETVTYENGWYLKPKVTQYRSEGFNPDDPANYKNIKGQGTLNADGETMEAITVTADMLAMFYYAREIDFESMQPGQSITIPINVEGGTPERVNITYDGKATTDINGSSYPTYDITFEYSYHGAMSGYPVKMQIGAESRIPVRISASLPVGHVEMIHDI